MKVVWFFAILILNTAIVTTMFYTTDTQATAFLVPAVSAAFSIAIIIVASNKVKKHVGWLTLLSAALSIPATIIISFLMIAFRGGLGPT